MVLDKVIHLTAGLKYSVYPLINLYRASLMQLAFILPAMACASNLLKSLLPSILVQYVVKLFA